MFSNNSLPAERPSDCRSSSNNAVGHIIPSKKCKITVMILSQGMVFSTGWKRHKLVSATLQGQLQLKHWSIWHIWGQCLEF